MILETLAKQKLGYPEWMIERTCGVYRVGSYAYGSNLDDTDVDVFALVVPPRDNLFPSLYGQIEGFGPKVTPWSDWTKHHVEMDGNSHDMTFMSVAKAFHLALKGHPNMLDWLFCDKDCIMYNTPAAEFARKNSHLFVSKTTARRASLYAYSQLTKMQSSVISEKAPYHVVRFSMQALSVVETGSLVIRPEDQDFLKKVRTEKWGLDEVQKFWRENMFDFDQRLDLKCNVPISPSFESIKKLLLEVIEDYE